MSQELFIACPGGSLGAGLLRELARFANQHHVERIRITHRQNLALSFPKRLGLPDKLPKGLKALASAQDNVMSSALAYKPESSRNWLSESRLLEIVQGLPQTKGGPSVSVFEPKAPFFSLQDSQLSFVASPVAEHWKVYWNLQGQIESLSGLAPNHLLPKIHGLFQEYFFRNKNIDSVNKKKSLHSLLLSQFAPSLLSDGFEKEAGPNEKSNHFGFSDSNFLLEGFQKSKEHYELGFFRRDHNFSALFLDELGYLCRKSHIGRVYLSPRHSFYIKNIAAEFLPEWEELLSRHGISLRHSQNELSFRLDHNAVFLYQYLVESLQKKGENLRRGLCGIVRSGNPLLGDLCISIRKQLLWTEYELYKKNNFSEEESTFYLPIGNFPNRRLLARGLAEAQRYSEGLLPKAPEQRAQQTQPPRNELRTGFRCQDCGFIYEKEYGDPLSQVPEGAPFASLPESYSCPVCGNPKAGFETHEFSNNFSNAKEEVLV